MQVLFTCSIYSGDVNSGERRFGVVRLVDLNNVELLKKKKDIGVEWFRFDSAFLFNQIVFYMFPWKSFCIFLQSVWESLIYWFAWAVSKIILNFGHFLIFNNSLIKKDQFFFYNIELCLIVSALTQRILFLLEIDPIVRRCFFFLQKRGMQIFDD